MAKQRLDDLGEGEKCPGCGRRCLSLKKFDTGDFLATHEFGKQMVKASATGNMIECGVLMDGCTSRGKIGWRHKEKEVVASEWEDF